MSGRSGALHPTARSSHPPIQNAQTLDLRGLARAVRAIRSSNLFDESTYAFTSTAAAAGIDPVVHYLQVGEAAGAAPSLKFNPKYYGERYPEVGAAKGSRLLHYLTIGQAKSHRPIPLAANFRFPDISPEPDRKTVLLLIHKAARTEAPILAWNICRRLADRNKVVAVLMNAGEITTAFENVATAVVAARSGERVSWDALEAGYLARALIAKYAPKYAIANGVSTRALAPHLASAFVPVIALVHEFASSAGETSLMNLCHSASAVVFPDTLVARSVENACWLLKARESVVVPQGRSLVPRRKSPSGRESGPFGLASRLRPVGAEAVFLVVGLGPADVQGGVGAFLTTATELKRLSPERPVRFVWIGDTVDCSSGEQYSFLIAEQIKRLGLADVVTIVDAVDDLSPVYEAADVVFLSSSSDLQPNVAIDAGLAGVPVVCFENASVIAKILGTDPALKDLVVPHFDCVAAGRVIVELIENDERRKLLAARIRELTEKTFDMDRYVDAVMELGEKKLALADQQRKDLKLLERKAIGMEHGAARRRRMRELRRYLVQSGLLGVRRDPVPGIRICRPIAGFHPLIYARDCPDFAASTLEDPCAHYLRTGLPEGPWKHSVIESCTGVRKKPPPLRVMLHGHFHYPELLSGLLILLAGADFRCDLLITTNAEEKRQQIEKEIAGYDHGAVDVRIVPNRGRDIGALLSGFPDKAWQGYDIIGHLHGKRSTGITVNGERWRDFLWQNLVGARGYMASAILSSFADPTLGLVFPEDPNLIGWEENLAAAQTLAARMGLFGPLPTHIDFPAGTMFWARPEALAPLFALNLAWDDYPEEPAPADGTILHAIERLLPLVTRQAGYRYATTKVPGYESY